VLYCPSYVAYPPDADPEPRVRDKRRESCGCSPDSGGRLKSLSNTAIAAFEVLQTGNVGIGGSTVRLLYDSFKAIRALADHSPT